jgi:nucleotidyltransferase substrate binding protein (TIGR01987 family)
MSITNEKPRWVYRFENFTRAFNLLQEALTLKQNRELSQLEKEGIVQRFEFTWKLSWKVLKDYLEYSGIFLEIITPTSVIRAAYAANLISEAELWMRSLDARNKMSHVYNLKIFEQIITEIENEFSQILTELQIKLQTQVDQSIWKNMGSATNN